MHHFKKTEFFTLLSFFIQLSVYPLYAKEPLTFEKLPYSEKIKKKLKENKIVAECDVKDLKEKKQSLKFSAAGLHTNSCRKALRKLSRYETFKNDISFLKESSYDDKVKRVHFVVASSLLDYNMTVNFKLDRIKKTGVYPFIFDVGFLLGLKGVIHVSEYEGRCLFVSDAVWMGPDTGFSSKLFELFAKTMTKMIMSRLFEISKTI